MVCAGGGSFEIITAAAVVASEAPTAGGNASGPAAATAGAGLCAGRTRPIVGSAISTTNASTSARSDQCPQFFARSAVTVCPNASSAATATVASGSQPGPTVNHAIPTAQIDKTMETMLMVDSP